MVEVAGLSDRLAWLQAEISEQERKRGPALGEVRLLPVTKGHGPQAPMAAVALGLLELGENYVQECRSKRLALRESGRAPVRWHMLGHLQRNKVRQAAALFSVVETIDSLEVAQALSRAAEVGAPLPVLCEVDLTGLPGRRGYSPERLRQELPALLELPGLELRGLMTVAPKQEPARCFDRCRRLRDELAQLVGAELGELSMGMSADFKEAIGEGSTEVRVGSLLFGSRD